MSTSHLIYPYFTGGAIPSLAFESDPIVLVMTPRFVIENPCLACNVHDFSVYAIIYFITWSIHSERFIKMQTMSTVIKLS